MVPERVNGIRVSLAISKTLVVYPVIPLRCVYCIMRGSV